MITSFESVLQAFKTALVNATDAEDRVVRRSPGAWSADSLPGIEVGRGPINTEPFAPGIDKSTVLIRVALLVADGDDAETTLDALHAQAHAAIRSSSALAALGKGLRLIETEEPEVEGGDPDVARMRTTYQIFVLTRTADLSRAQ